MFLKISKNTVYIFKLENEKEEKGRWRHKGKRRREIFGFMMVRNNLATFSPKADKS